MTPSTFAGLVLFAASLGPGFVYLQSAERRRPRAERSPLAEAVEMVVIGAALSLLSLVLVLVVARATGWLHWSDLIRRPTAYIADHPFRVLGPLLAALVLSYGAAFGAAGMTHAGASKVVHPGVTMWQQALWLDRPDEEHSTVATIELRDGRLVTGLVRGFTAEQRDNRELLLEGPFAVRRSEGASVERVEESFMVIRECDVAYLMGHFYGPAELESEQHRPGSHSDPTCPQARP